MTSNKLDIEKTSVIIITPIELEFQAVLQHLHSIQIFEEEKTGSIYYLGLFDAASQQHQIAVLLSGSGIVETSVSALEGVRLFQPSILMLVGIAGGVKDVQLGDVVIGTKAYGYESGKQLEKSFVARPHVKNYSHRLIERARVIAREKKWQERVLLQTENKLPGFNLDTVSTFFGPIASGNKVLASDRSIIVQNLKQHFNDTLAVEMEAIGLEVLDRFPMIMTINIRSISDLLSSKTHTDSLGYQDWAAAHASAFAFELLASIEIKASEKETTDIKSTLLNLIDNQRLDKTFQLMLDWLEEEEDLLDELIVLKGAYEGFKRDLYLGVMNDEQAQLNLELICQSLHQLINKGFS